MSTITIPINEHLKLTKEFTKVGKSFISELETSLTADILAANESYEDYIKQKEELAKQENNLKKLEKLYKLYTLKVKQEMLVPKIAETIHEITNEDIDDILIELSVGEESILSSIGKGIMFVFKTIVNIVMGIINFIINIIKAVINFILGLFGKSTSSGGSGGSSSSIKNTIKNAKTRVEEVKKEVMKAIKNEFKKENKITYKTIFDTVISIMRNYAEDYVRQIININNVYTHILPEHDKPDNIVLDNDRLKIHSVAPIFEGTRVTEVNPTLNAITIGDFYDIKSLNKLYVFLSRINDGLESIIESLKNKENLLLSSFLVYENELSTSFFKLLYYIDLGISTLALKLEKGNFRVDIFNDYESILKDKIIPLINKNESNSYLCLDLDRKADSVLESIFSAKEVLLRTLDEDKVDTNKLEDILDRLFKDKKMDDNSLFIVSLDFIAMGNNIKLYELLSNLKTEGLDKEFENTTIKKLKYYNDLANAIVKFNGKIDSDQIYHLLSLVTIAMLTDIYTSNTGVSLLAIFKRLNEKIKPELVTQKITPLDLNNKKLAFAFLSSNNEKNIMDKFFVNKFQFSVEKNKRKIMEFSKNAKRFNKELDKLDIDLTKYTPNEEDTKVNKFKNILDSLIKLEDIGNEAKIEAIINETFNSFTKEELRKYALLYLKFIKLQLLKEEMEFVKKFVLNDLKLMLNFTRLFLDYEDKVGGLDTTGNRIFFGAYLEYYNLSTDNKEFTDEIITNIKDVEDIVDKMLKGEKIKFKWM